jgi:hypothetical protein
MTTDARSERDRVGANAEESVAGCAVVGAFRMGIAERDTGAVVLVCGRAFYGHPADVYFD